MKKKVGVSGAYIKAYALYPLLEDDENLVDVSKELMKQRIWFYCNHDLKCDALVATLPEYRETFGVNLNAPALVYYSADAPTLAGFN